MLKTKDLSVSKNDSYLKSSKNALTLFLVAALSVLSAKSRISGYLSFVNVGIASVSGIWGVFSFAASALTYIVTGTLKDAVVQLGAMIVIIGIKLATGIKPTPVRNAFLTASALVFCSLVASFVTRTTASLFWYRICFSLLCGCMVYFLEKIIKKSASEKALELSGINGGAVVLAFLLMIATLCSTEIYSLNLGRMVGILAVFLCAKKFRISGGAVCGALVTFGVILYSPEMSKNTLFLCASGLVSGALCSFGNIVMTIGFVLSAVMGLAATGFNNDSFAMLTDVSVAAVIFAVIPSDIQGRLLKLVNKKSNSKTSAGDNISSQLGFTSDTLKDVRKRLEEISQALLKEEKNISISRKVKKEICSQCENKGKCWNENYNYTAGVFSKIEKLLCENENYKIDFPQFCHKQQELEECFVSVHNQYACELASKEKSTQLRELLSQQLSATGQLLDDLSAKASGLAQVNEQLSVKAARLFEKMGISAVKACVYKDENKAVRAEVFTSKEIKCDMVKLTVDLSEILDCEMEMPVTSRVNGITKLVFCEAADYRLSSGISQQCAKEGDYCGDTLERIWLSGSEFVVILSDGMGTGKRAKLDSSFTANLVSRFTASGVSPETALKLINSILRVKGWDESFATADIGVFDLCSGRVKFIKSGAAPSYILRDGVLIKIQGQGFPLGILNEASPYVSEYKLFEGDRVIVTSDGVDEIAIKQSVNEIIKNNLNAVQSAEIISQLMKNRVGEGQKDDISVCVSEIFMR